MRFAVEHPASRRELLQALCRVPEDVRRFALERVLFVSLGGSPGPGLPFSIAGLAVPRSRYADADWVVPLLDRNGIGLTAVHEVAHAMCGHATGGVEHEREAATLVRSWGFVGESADPDGCAARCEAALERVSLMRAHVEGGALCVTCTCGAGCRVFAPTVAGLPADVGVECPACGWVAIMAVGNLLPCTTCGGTAGVTWAGEPTPELPVAARACSCGEVATFTLRTEPPPPSPVVEPAELDLSDAAELRWLLRGAATALMSAEAALRRQPDEVILASCAGMGPWAHGLLLRAVALLDGDARAPVVASCAEDVAAAGRLLHLGELAGAADQLRAAAGVLNVMLAEQGATT